MISDYSTALRSENISVRALNKHPPYLQAVLEQYSEHVCVCAEMHKRCRQLPAPAAVTAAPRTSSAQSPAQRQGDPIALGTDARLCVLGLCTPLLAHAAAFDGCHAAESSSGLGALALGAHSPMIRMTDCSTFHFGFIQRLQGAWQTNLGIPKSLCRRKKVV